MGEENETSSNTISTDNAGNTSSTSTSNQAILPNDGRALFGTILRGLSYGAGIAGAFAIALNAQFGDQIKAYFDNTKKEAYYIATIEQQSNEQKRTNQLMERQQLLNEQQNKAVDGLRVDLEFSRKNANRERDEMTQKLDFVIQENKTEKLERQKIAAALDLTTSNVNAVTLELKKCRQDCLKMRN